jgi:hypothetical protein
VQQQQLTAQMLAAPASDPVGAAGAAAAMQRLYGPGTVHDRFGDLEGLLMLQAMYEAYKALLPNSMWL